MTKTQRAARSSFEGSAFAGPLEGIYADPIPIPERFARLPFLGFGHWNLGLDWVLGAWSLVIRPAYSFPKPPVYVVIQT
jgi:hypothetical protein